MVLVVTLVEVVEDAATEDVVGAAVTVVLGDCNVEEVAGAVAVVFGGRLPAHPATTTTRIRVAHT
ncbi:MAG: hypothetical protein M1274_08470 [Actinobacteria bacterium]|nr:hypothetical protein [Actinomycetota bacterium]